MRTCHLSWALAALTVLCAFRGSNAQDSGFLSDIHFTPLANGGQMFYLEAKGAYLRLNKGTGAQPGDDGWDAQSFTVSKGFPSSPFTIFNQDTGRFFDATNGTMLLMMVGTGKISQQWIINSFGQFESVSSNNVLTYKTDAKGYAKKFTNIFLSKKLTTADIVTQTWVMVPHVAPPTNKFQVFSIGSNPSKAMCLSSGPAPVAGAANAPVLAACNAADPTQVVETIFDEINYDPSYGVAKADWNWPVAAFRLRFPSTGLCLGSVANLYVSSPDTSAPYFLVQTLCDNSALFPMVSMVYNSRGQLQPYYATMVCLNMDKGAPSAGSCSRTLPTSNRWMFRPL